jgi:hypothetical protein
VLARSKAKLRPPLGGVVRVLLAATAALAPMLIHGFPTAARLAVGAVIYVVLLVALRAIPEELWVELRRIRESFAAR